MRPVTGPDGDNPITDEQIRELWSKATNAITGRTLMTALSEPFPSGDYPSAEMVNAARAHCADAYNALHGAES